MAQKALAGVFPQNSEGTTSPQAMLHSARGPRHPMKRYTQRGDHAHPKQRYTQRGDHAHPMQRYTPELAQPPARYAVLHATRPKGTRCAPTTSLPFVHTARRYYRLNCSVGCPTALSFRHPEVAPTLRLPGRLPPSAATTAQSAHHAVQAYTCGGLQPSRHCVHVALHKSPTRSLATPKALAGRLPRREAAPILCRATAMEAPSTLHRRRLP